MVLATFLLAKQINSIQGKFKYKLSEFQFLDVLYLQSKRTIRAGLFGFVDSIQKFVVAAFQDLYITSMPFNIILSRYYYSSC